MHSIITFLNLKTCTHGVHSVCKNEKKVLSSNEDKVVIHEVIRGVGGEKEPKKKEQK